MNIEQTNGCTAIVRGVVISVDGMGFNDAWLKRLARVVRAMPDDLRKEFRFIGCSREGDEDWPPCSDNWLWWPGYWIQANPDVIRHESVRQQINDIFLQVDAGHPGIGWLFFVEPWVDGEPLELTDEMLLSDEPLPGRLLLTVEEELEMMIEPAGWGAMRAGAWSDDHATT